MKKVCTSFIIMIMCFVSFCFVGCKADSIDVSLYTSDIDAAYSDVVLVPVTAIFKMMGEDKDGLLDKVSVIVKSYLPANSNVNIVNGDWGKQLVIDTQMPLGTFENLVIYGKTNKILAYILLVRNEDTSDTLYFMKSPACENLNNKLGKINMMISFDFPSNKTNIRVISDSKDDKMVSARSTWVSKKPHLLFNKKLKKREEVEMMFKGGDDSVYSVMEPFFHIWKI